MPARCWTSLPGSQHAPPEYAEVPPISCGLLDHHRAEPGPGERAAPRSSPRRRSPPRSRRTRPLSSRANTRTRSSDVKPWTGLAGWTRRDRRAESPIRPSLPVSQRRDDIAAAIRDHQVVIVAGETGSGQDHPACPRSASSAARGGRGGLIGHTQPRRIAARSVAERIAERDSAPSWRRTLVGYQVRFTDRTSRSSRVKLMTDGILLAELQRDRDAQAATTRSSSTRPTSAASTSTSCSATSSGCCRAGPT